VRADQIGVDTVAHDILKNTVLFWGTKAIVAPPVEIGDARHEGKAECVAESEVADLAAIDMMPNNIEASIGFQQSVEHMDGLACRGCDDLHMEWSISARDRGVEFDDRVGAVSTVNAADDFTTVAEMDMLAIGGGNAVRSELTLPPAFIQS
jgi:hypothetical protein